ncbi:MAG: ABC transporter substrate-binding protein [Alphaproteobacteria bacterium]
MTGTKTVRRAGLVAATSLLALAAAAGTASAEVKMGALMGITGDLASFIPPILDAANLAVTEVNAQGGILGGQELVLAVGDTQATAQGAVDAATKLVNVDNVAAVMGALASGATIAAANAVCIPNGVLQVSPTSTSPEMTTLEDNDFLFRVIPSDDFQGIALAKMLLDEGITSVALTYVNNDYGVGIAGTFREAYTAAGGTITGDQVHEPEKSSYRSELATLASAGDAQALVLIAYAAGSGITIVRQALENGFFDRFVGTDGLRDNLLIQEIGAENLEGIMFSSPTSPPASTAGEKFEANYTAAYETTNDKFFIQQTYDATFLVALAIEKAGSTDRAAIRDALREVANPPGEIIEPGEWAKALALIAAGTDIDYNGVAGPADFDENGDVAGYIGKFVLENGEFVEAGIIDVE